MAEYQPRTDAEIKEIALGLMAGSIFCDRALKDDAQHLTMVFMPLGLIDDQEMLDGIKAILIPEDGRYGMIYEYLSEAGPRSINGYPTFFSFRLLSADDVDRVDEVIKRLEAV